MDYSLKKLFTASTLSKFIIKNCTITGNEATNADGHGGGIYCENADLEVDHTDINNNKISGDLNKPDTNLRTLHCKVKFDCASWCNGVIAE